MIEQKHIINKVFFEVHTSDTKTAYDLKDNLDVFLKQNLFPTLQAYFDNIITEKDQIIRCDKLELELNAANIKDQVQLQLDIVKSLQKQLILNKESSYRDTIEDPSVSIINKEKSDIQTFFYFLETGQNPWWDLGKNLEDNLFIETVLSSKNFLSKFRERVQNKAIRKRLIYQFSDKALSKMLTQDKPIKSFPKVLKKDVRREQYWEIITRFVADKNLKLLKDSLTVLVSNLKKETWKPKNFTEVLDKEIQEIVKSEKKQKPIAWQNTLIDNLKRILSEELKSNKILKTKTLAEKVIHKLPEELKEHIETKVLRKIVKTSVQIIHKNHSGKTKNIEKEILSFTSELISEKLEIFQSRNGDRIVGSTKQDKNDLIKPTNEQLTRDYIQKPKTNEQENKILAREQIGKQFIEETVEGANAEEVDTNTSLYIQNAGLLLLHPYLNRFFETLKLLDEKGKIKQDKAELAVHLLHYLATKKEKQVENKLVFEKFLCGYPIDKSIRKNIRLPQKLKLEAEHVLEAVLKNWQALKNTSADGLRENFIKRDGKLILNEESRYRIVVERKTQDILLEKLPWNLTIIRLPWIDKLIFVEW
ncbi:contractile injection system tape measure protein [Aquimarina sp. 2201CG14-23]|uniref:contractile injection system tape measure protein n=1 Tax=Aquimarina mycalae TaxID=3040073 RepID=UPI002477F4CB|nr:contractile injection system tape measure protein [Aquimarina sp. 2201CG14-23]MDH7444134.1 contractile injection system tape measure protein [Aquimarina sp. 2201CG14-23]